MITFDDIKSYLPQYLTTDQQQRLFRNLKDFENRNYYTNRHPSDMLQGDGWTGIEIVRFEDGARDRIRGILLSNSCDIDPANPRDLPPKIVFAPLIRLQRYEEVLSGKLAREVIDNKISAIRRQRVSSLFFLPTGSGLDEDHVAVLDDLHTIPLRTFQDKSDRVKLFTLSQMGFYLFLFKLSIHFCRFQEAVIRDVEQA